MARQLNSDKRIITATEIRRNFSAIIRRLRKRREHTIIQSSGVPIAVLLPVAEYERLMAYVKRKAAFHDFARNLGREVEQRGISEEDFMADLEKAAFHSINANLLHRHTLRQIARLVNVASAQG